MARALPISQSTAQDTETPARDWQALRGELVALLDQMEGHYGRGGAAESGLAQRVRDLRYQVVESDPDDRRREALRSVKRQIDRFTDRAELGTGANENALQSAIAQIRARSPVAVPGRSQPAPVSAPESTPAYSEMARTMTTLTHRLGELEAELGTRHGDRTQVREIADQVGQLSQVVELLAGAIGETGQLQRLESQIAELATLMGQGRQADLAQLTDRLDQVAATVDRLADLQVQQIQHVVREAEAGPQKDAETVRGIKAIEASIRSLYDRIDSLESGLGSPSAELERLTETLGQLANRLSTDGNRPDRLLGLVDALNGRLTEIEESGYNLDSLRGDLERLRIAVLDAVEPRFSAIEQRLGDLGERLDGHAADSQGITQVEAQIRQLVARMDQTGEQLAVLAQRPPAERPDFEALATLAATRAAETLAQTRPEPDFDALADLVAGRTRAAIGSRETPAADLSESSLAEIEDRVGRLVDGFLRAQAADRAGSADHGMQHVEDRLAQLETVLSRPAPAAPAASVSAGQPGEAPPAPVEKAAPRRPRSLNDMMPRDPSVEAPLKEFGFPDLAPVRAALQARNGTAATESAARRPLAAEPPAAPEAAAPATPEQPERPTFDPEATERPPRPQSIFDREVNSAFDAPVQPAAAPGEPVPAASRNTFIEAARRSAQRQNAARTAADANSPIGRALSRLHTGKPEKAALPAAPAQESTPAVKAEPPAKRRGLLGRRARPEIESKAEAGTAPEAGRKAARRQPTAAPETPKAVAPVDAAPRVTAERRPAKPESFLSRHRREILLGASIVAIAFMTFNLVAQRLAPDTSDAMSAAAIPTMPEPAAAPASTAPTATAPKSAPVTPAAAAPKPISFSPAEAVPNPTSVTAAAAAPDPSAAPSTDPATTASIAPDETAVATPPPAAVMPPPLVAPAAAPGAAGADIASTPLVTSAAPPALKSPVKVDLAPDSVGPLALRQAAADGDARSQFEVGAIYSEGKVVPQDFKQASVWYERAAEQGFAPAEYRLGNLYETGKGVTKDYEQAHLWYERAANAGNRMAMHNLAALFAGGQFGKQDFASAANWFEKAADLGIRDSQFNLGMLYARGLGVPQNLETSYKWFALAAETGDSGAIKARDDIARSLDADQLKAAKAEVAAFKPGTVDLAANFAPIGTWDKKFNPGPTITTRSVVLKVQQALARLGFDVGTPDGQAGPKTAQAIKAFEQGTGMTQVGAINPRLLAVLGSQPV